MIKVSGACKASFNVCLQEEGGTGKLRRQVIDHLRESVAESAGSAPGSCPIWPELGTLSADLAYPDTVNLICCGQTLKVQSGQIATIEYLRRPACGAPIPCP